MAQPSVEAIARYAADWGATTRFAAAVDGLESFSARDFDAVVVELPAQSAAEIAAVGARLRAVFPAPAVNLIALVGQAVPIQAELGALFSAVLRAPVHRRALFSALRGGGESGVVPEARSAVPESFAPALKDVNGMLRVLVVDDNAMNRKPALRQLEKLGIAGDAVSGGAAAIDAVATQRYPVVLMDCQMPVIDGYEATRQIRSRENGSKRCAIIAMTAGAFAEDRLACLDAGMDDYLAKPVTLLAMRSVMKVWMPAAFA